MKIATALYQPEIAANLGAHIRVAACFDAALHVIEPCGFPWRERDISRVALDYDAKVDLTRHASWAAFCDAVPRRTVLLTTKGSTSLYDFQFTADDIVLLGQESAGVPDTVHEAVAHRVRIPLAAGARSLNVAVAGALALSEMRRQLGW